MTRISKQSERRAKCPQKNQKPALKTGPKKDNLNLGYKEHTNVLSGDQAIHSFIAKIK